MPIQRIIELRAAFQQSGSEDAMPSSSFANLMEPNDRHPMPDAPVSMQGGKKSASHGHYKPSNNENQLAKALYAQAWELENVTGAIG
jgi:hypothetical protein